MDRHLTDRNLLFGIFAFQLGFVTRSGLIGAMNAWVLDKSRPLSRVLLEQSALADDTLALLNSLVEKHLALHGQDSARSLAAVSSLANEVLEELKRINDSEVNASVAKVATAVTVDEVPGATVNVAVGASSTKGLRFRIVRPHAAGGLGLVYVAHDEELNRDVALKEIQGRHADHPESRTRFLLEAEITGGLEHPGIVPVYGLGQYADGRPFYAMRFIRGASLKEAIEKFHADARPLQDKSLDLRELLERLIDVCNAIQYAHDRGVLHRDLKPGNIMLGKYGETLVVDWGLAKPLGATADPHAPSLSEEPMLRPASASGSAATLQGAAVGTPQYMSPEQAAGRLDQLGAASDVYSLGATLYSLLTGVAPFQMQTDGAGKADVAGLLKRVQAGEFPAPRQRNAGISPPLEAICLRAMANDPANRYANPRALIDDLKHWLADEAVSAWPEPWYVKTRRWINRHRTFVTGAAAALVVGLFGSLAFTLLLMDRNAVIEGKNRELFDANIAIQAESKKRETQRLLAVEARKKAEDRLDQSVETLKLFANDARAYCEDAMVPGESKRALFGVLADQLDALAAGAEEKEFNEDKIRARIFLHETVALVQLELARSVDAEKNLRKALKLADRWLTAKPGDPAALGRRAAVVHLLGVSNTRLFRVKIADEHYKTALEIRQKLLGNAQVERFTPGKTRMDLADSLDALERWDESIPLRVEAYDIAKKTGKAKEIHFALDGLNWTYQKAASRTDVYVKKKVYMEKADATSAELLKLRPAGRVALDRWYNMTLTHAQTEERQASQAKDEVKAKLHLAAAQRLWNKHVELARKLATSKDLLDHRRALANSWEHLARLEKTIDKTKLAADHLAACLHVREELLRDYSLDPNRVSLQIDRFITIARLGRHAEAAQGAEVLAIKFGDKITAYRLARLYSVCIAAVTEARQPAPPTPDDLKLQKTYRDNALESLDRALRQGFDDWEELRAEPDLAPLRSDPRFRKILEAEKK